MRRGAFLSKAPLLLALLILSAGPALALPKPDTTEATDTKRESCIRACNSEHALCGESEATRFEGADMPSGMIGAAAACDQSLRSCLKACK